MNKCCMHIVSNHPMVYFFNAKKNSGKGRVLPTTVVRAHVFQLSVPLFGPKNRSETS